MMMMMMMMMMLFINEIEASLAVGSLLALHASRLLAGLGV